MKNENRASNPVSGALTGQHQRLSLLTIRRPSPPFNNYSRPQTHLCCTVENARAGVNDLLNSGDPDLICLLGGAVRYMWEIMQFEAARR
jgi:hypothetical protein